MSLRSRTHRLRWDTTRTRVLPVLLAGFLPLLLLLHHSSARAHPTTTTTTDTRAAAALLSAGLAAEGRGEHARAVALYEESALRGAGSSHVWVAHYNLAVVRRKMGNIDDAVYAGHQAWRLNPRSSDVAFNLGNAYQERQQHLEAIELFEAGAVVEPVYAP